MHGLLPKKKFEKIEKIEKETTKLKNYQDLFGNVYYICLCWCLLI